jgi:hypothetical protein
LADEDLRAFKARARALPEAEQAEAFRSEEFRRLVADAQRLLRADCGSHCGSHCYSHCGSHCYGHAPETVLKEEEALT